MNNDKLNEMERELKEREEQLPEKEDLLERLRVLKEKEIIRREKEIRNEFYKLLVITKLSFLLNYICAEPEHQQQRTWRVQRWPRRPPLQALQIIFKPFNF